MLGSHPVEAPLLVLVRVGVLAVSRWVALASVCAALALVPVAVLADEDVLWAVVLWAVVLCAVVLVRHRRNFVRRLRRGT